MVKPKYRLLMSAVIGILAIVFAGCATTESRNAPAGGTSQSASAGGTSPAAVQRDKGESPVYRDFGDVLVPGEMETLPKSSFVYITSGLTAGVLTLEGHVDAESLIAFFQNNMIRDNWKMVSYFKSPKSIMLFKKETRWCVIIIYTTPAGYFTTAEIWVAPTLADAESAPLR